MANLSLGAERSAFVVGASKLDFGRMFKRRSAMDRAHLHAAHPHRPSQPKMVS
jgi:hypothetical protein